MIKQSIYGLAFCSIISCTKKETSPEPSTSVDSAVQENEYSPVAIGNYWVYEHYQVYPDGSEVKLTKTDSVMITRDTILQGKKYAVLEGTNNPYNSTWNVVKYLRDSAGYLSNNVGFYPFSSKVVGDTLFTDNNAPDSLTRVKSWWWMKAGEQQVFLPAGIFTVKDNIQRKSITLGFNTKTEDYDNLYAKGVGLVLSQYNYQYSMGMYKYEKRLVRYHAVLRNTH